MEQIGKDKKTQKLQIPKDQENKKAKKIIKKCLQQNQHFKKWHQSKNFDGFHHSHYDWWAFPIDEPSSYGHQYAVGKQEIAYMKDNEQFIEALSTNAFMVCWAWGFDLKKGTSIPKKQCEKNQQWQNWPIRLYKMTKSLQIFSLTEYFKNAITYGNKLISEGHIFVYGKRNMYKYFQSKNQKNNQMEDKKNNLRNTNKIVVKNQQNKIEKRYISLERISSKLLQKTKPKPNPKPLISKSIKKAQFKTKQPPISKQNAVKKSQIKKDQNAFSQSLQSKPK